MSMSIEEASKVQEEAILKLEKDGWRERSRYRYIPDEDYPHEDGQVVVMVKHPTRYATHYRDVDPIGRVS